MHLIFFVQCGVRPVQTSTFTSELVENMLIPASQERLQTLFSMDLDHPCRRLLHRWGPLSCGTRRGTLHHHQLVRLAGKSMDPQVTIIFHKARGDWSLCTELAFLGHAVPCKAAYPLWMTTLS